MMDLSPNIYMYIFTGEERRYNKNSEERIRRCASHFIYSERKANIKIPEIHRQNNEKPCFAADIRLCFSVSHSGEYWVCAVSEQQIGVDVQKKSNGFQKSIAERFFHPDEYQYLIQNKFNDFFDIWTAKESYVKYTGQGLGDDFSDFSVVKENRIFEYVNGVCIKFIPLDLNYSLCVCAKTISEKNTNVLIDPLLPAPAQI